MCNGVNDCGNFLDEQHCPEVNYQFRLANSSHRGLLEVHVNSRWGLVCDTRFSMTEAHVACKELGFAQGAIELLIGANGTQPNDARFQMDAVDCSGFETSLKQCSHLGWGVHNNCSLAQAVGVVCNVPNTNKQCPAGHWLCETSDECLPLTFLCDGVRDCTDSSDEDERRCAMPNEFRLSGEPAGETVEGRIEVRIKGVWGTVCDDEFGETEALVFCKSIGFNGPAVSF